MAMQGQFFAGIQGLRLVAAFAVLIARAVFVADHGHTGPAAVRLGRIGVILFFAISGFVIALQRHKPVGEFIMLRFLRIYPPYWIAVALESALFATVGLPVGATADRCAVPDRSRKPSDVHPLLDPQLRSGVLSGRFLPCSCPTVR